MRFRSASNWSRLKYRLGPHGSFELAAVASTDLSCLADTASLPSKDKPSTRTPLCSSLQPSVTARDKASSRRTTRFRWRIGSGVRNHEVCQRWREEVRSTKYEVRGTG